MISPFEIEAVLAASVSLFSVLRHEPVCSLRMSGSVLRVSGISLASLVLVWQGEPVLFRFCTVVLSGTGCTEAVGTLQVVY